MSLRHGSFLLRGLYVCGLIGTLSTAFADPMTDFMLHCMGCHGTNAQGVPGKVPPLAHTLTEFMRTPAGRNYVLRVPGAANSMLSDSRLAEVLNWIAQHFGGADEFASVRPFSTAEVSASRHTPLVSVQGLAATGAARTRRDRTRTFNRLLMSVPAPLLPRRRPPTRIVATG